MITLKEMQRIDRLHRHIMEICTKIAIDKAFILDEEDTRCDEEKLKKLQRQWIRVLLSLTHV